MARRLITGLTPDREQAWQERQMLIIARNAEVAIKRELGRGYRAVARGEDDAVDNHKIRMQRVLERIYSKAFDVFGARMWQSIQKSKQPTEQKRDVPLTPQFDLARRLWIAQNAATKVTEIAGTTESQALEIIRKATEDAVEQGLDERLTAELIQKRIGEQGGQLSRLRSRVISRTESHAASAASTQMAAKASGIPMQKQWISSTSERTRGAHKDANGQIVGIDEPFIVDGERLMQPGDINGSAANVINCRCVVGYSL